MGRGCPRPIRSGFDGRGCATGSVSAVIPGGPQGREGDPLWCLWRWIPFPSATLRPGMTGRGSTVEFRTVSSPAVRRTGKGIHPQARCHGFPSAARPSGNGTEPRQGLSCPDPVCSLFVLDFCPRLGYRKCIPPRRGAHSRGVASCGGGNGPAAGLYASSSGRRPRLRAGFTFGPGPPALWRCPPWAEAEPAPPVRLKEPCARGRQARPLTTASSRSALRAPLDPAPRLRATRPGAQRRVPFSIQPFSSAIAKGPFP